MTPMGQLVLDLPHRAALGRDDFLVAPSNADAVEWLDRWPDWPAPALALHGPPGCGKTHLAQVWQARSGAATVTAASLALGDVPALAQQGAVVIDDAEAAPEQPLLHLYNLLAERRGTVLLAAARPPASWTLRLADLRSRLLSCPAVAMEAPDEALIGAVLVKLFAYRQLAVKEDLIVFLLEHIERSFAAAGEIVAALDRAALAQRRRITVRLARELLPPPQA